MTNLHFQPTHTSSFTLCCVASMMSSPYMLIIWQTTREVSIQRYNITNTTDVIFLFIIGEFNYYSDFVVRRLDRGGRSVMVARLPFCSCMNTPSVFTWSLSQFCSSSVPRSSRPRVCLLYVTMKPAIGAEASPALYRVISPLMSSPLKQKHKEEKRLYKPRKCLSYLQGHFEEYDGLREAKRCHKVRD